MVHSKEGGRAFKGRQRHKLGGAPRNVCELETANSFDLFAT